MNWHPSATKNQHIYDISELQFYPRHDHQSLQKLSSFLHCIWNCDYRHFIFAILYKIIISLIIFSISLMLPKRCRTSFWWNMVFNSNFEFGKQELCFLRHISSHLKDDLNFENLFWQLCMVPHLFLKKLRLFILNKRMKIEYYLQTISYVD
jgi:hypothetical protein